MATLFSVIKTLENIALEQPNVRSAGENDLYGLMNGNPEVKYSVFYITQGKHKSTEEWDTWEFNLFYIDRLTDNKDNELRIESTAKQVLDSVLATFCSRYSAEVVGERVYQPFTESFKDRTAGVYVTVRILMPKDVICIE